MTITMYSGTPGSGKSLHAVHDVRFWLNRRHPRPVIANFPLDEFAPVKQRETYHYYPNGMLTPKLITDFCDDYWTNVNTRFREGYVKVVFDECQLLWNARNWSAKDRLAWVELMSQHRKYGIDMILIAQSAKMIDNQFRMLIEYEYLHRKISNLGLIGGLIGLLTFDRLYWHINTYFQTGEQLGLDWFVASKKDFRMYDTHARFQRKDSALLPAVADPSA